MSYHALYRAYRPRRFCEVIGQDHITTILKNQIMSGRTAHAYLFCGTRGTGKTSTAKILARAVNCLAVEDGEPCLHCDACAREDGSNVDIIELDAASNNGVDDMRSLIEKARFTPLYLKTKVYIIDEAHMLSQSAFNALLKTLEEPPSHIMFILATTEPQRIPATIISRCQRFDFRRLKVSDMVERMREVLSSAGANIDEEGLLAIARAAQGGMRDALSLADQCISFCGRDVTAADVYDVLGSIDEDFLFQMADRLIASDPSGALKLLDRAVSGGRDMNVFVRELAMHFRALLLAVNCGRCSEMLECTEEAMTRYIEQAEDCPRERMLRSMELLLETQSNLKWLTSPRALIEATLIKICRPYDERNFDALLDRMAMLEQRVASGAAVPQTDRADITDHENDAPPWAEQTEIPVKTEEAPGKKEKASEKKTEEPAEKPQGPRPVAVPPVQKQNQAPKNDVPHTKTAAPARVAADVTGIWQPVLESIKKKSLVLYTYMLKAGKVWLEGKTLHIGFDADAIYNAVKTHEYTGLIASVMAEAAPGYALVPVLADSEEFIEDRVKAMFGDKFTVVS